jgi:hypothetical protein
MALWGNKDAKTSTGTIAIAANGLVTGSSTVFDNQAAVGDYINAGNKQYRITSITSNTVAQVAAGTLGGSITVVNSGAAYTLNEKPTFVSATSVDTDANNVFGVDTVEAGIKPVAHAGWVQRTIGTGNRAGRIQYETLVASGTITNDAADDTQFPDYVLSITTQPANDSANVTASETASFTVVAASAPAGATLAYQWQANTGSGFANVATGAVYSDVTTATLSVDDVTGLTGAQFRALVLATGADTITSAAATLTVTS